MSAICEDVSVALVGIGGYGNIYLASLLDAQRAAKNTTLGLRLVAVADPRPGGCNYLSELQRRHIPLYGSLAELQAKHAPELVILCSPPHIHSEQTVAALAHGSHVLCEKPLCTTPPQALAMIEARDRAHKQVSIGYQWSFSEGIQALKHDVISGLFGKPRRFRTLVLWPRNEVYYRRNNWAGRRYSASGRPLFDSPLNNACAHHLHNMMYVLGDRIDRSALPSTVEAELYRANEIETFDSCAVRVMTDTGVEVLFFVSHATEAAYGPVFSFEFEEATITFLGDQATTPACDSGTICARFRDGRVKQYGSPERAPDRKLWAAIDSVGSGKPTVCGIEASMAQTMVMAAVHQSATNPVNFPEPLVRKLGEVGRGRKWVQGLDNVLTASYEQGRLPHEMAVPWAVAGEQVRVAVPNVSHNEPNPIEVSVRIAPPTFKPAFAAIRPEAVG
jgi:predicted dehydrogenase